MGLGFYTGLIQRHLGVWKSSRVCVFLTRSGDSIATDPDPIRLRASYASHVRPGPIQPDDDSDDITYPIKWSTDIITDVSILTRNFDQLTRLPTWWCQRWCHHHFDPHYLAFWPAFEMSLTRVDLELTFWLFFVFFNPFFVLVFSYNFVFLYLIVIC